jgi:hypothetical protein
MQRPNNMYILAHESFTKNSSGDSWKTNVTTLVLFQ